MLVAFTKVEIFLIKGVVLDTSLVTILDTSLVIINTSSDAFCTSHTSFAASSDNLNIILTTDQLNAQILVL
jgi:hypothetical protein